MVLGSLERMSRRRPLLAVVSVTAMAAAAVALVFAVVNVAIPALIVHLFASSSSGLPEQVSRAIDNHAGATGWRIADREAGGWSSNEEGTCYVTGVSVAGQPGYRWVAVAGPQSRWRVITELPAAGYWDNDSVVGNEKAYRQLCRPP